MTFYQGKVSKVQDLFIALPTKYLGSIVQFSYGRMKRVDFNGCVVAKPKMKMNQSFEKYFPLSSIAQILLPPTDKIFLPIEQFFPFHPVLQSHL